MSKTKQEIRDFLNSQVGKRVNWKCGVFNGQCVSLIKALMEFLGAPNPYKARGHAKDAGNIYIRDGLGKPGRGWLTVCVGKKGKYGHIWIDLKNEANYEQNLNGDKRTHKNTRPISQADQFVNFDQWVISGAPARPATPPASKPAATYYGYGGITNSPVIERIAAFMRKNYPSYTPAKALGSLWGVNIERSIKEFQRRSGLVAYGKVDSKTMAALKKAGFKG